MKENINLQPISSNIKVYIPQGVEVKYNRLCQKFPDLEWSGICFFKVRNINVQIQNLEIDLVDIVPLSVDTQTSTGFNFGSAHVEYMVQNKLMNCLMGHIHSHNTMGVFFSGVDNDDLRLSSEFYNFLLSVIVNNKGEVMAKVAQKVETKQTFHSKLPNGQISTLEIKNTSVVTVYDCEIVKDDLNSTFDEWVKKIKQPLPITSKVNIGNIGTTETFRPSWFFDKPVNFKQGKLFDEVTSNTYKSVDNFFDNFIAQEVLGDYTNASLKEVLKNWEYEEVDWEWTWDSYCDEKNELDNNITEKIIFLETIESRIRKQNVSTNPEVALLLKKIQQEIKTAKNEQK